MDWKCWMSGKSPGARLYILSTVRNTFGISSIS
jgi:hypothetical protein